MNFKIKFINIGRNNHNSKIEKEFDTLPMAQQFAFKFANKFLMSSNTWLESGNEEDQYYIFAGMRNVGEIIIKEIS